MTILTTRASAKTFHFKRHEHSPDTVASADSVLAAEGRLLSPEEQTCRFAAVFICIRTLCALVTIQLTSSFQVKILSSVPKLYFQIIKEERAFLQCSKTAGLQLLGKDSLSTGILSI